MPVLLVEDLHGTVEGGGVSADYERTLGPVARGRILVLEGKVDNPLGTTAAGAGSGRRMGGAGKTGLRRRRLWAVPVPVLAPVPVAPPEQVVAPVTNGATHRVMRVDVPRGDDDNACLRVLEQLHGLVERYPGRRPRSSSSCAIARHP